MYQLKLSNKNCSSETTVVSKQEIPQAISRFIKIYDVPDIIFLKEISNEKTS